MKSLAQRWEKWLKSLIQAKFALSVSDNPRKKFDSAAETTIFTFQSPKCSPEKKNRKRAFSSSDDCKALLRSGIQGH